MYRNHNKGSKLHVIHPPRNPTAQICLLQHLINYAMQLYKAVPSNLWNQLNTLHYIDCMKKEERFVVLNFGMHDLIFILLSQTESYTIAHHLEINLLLSQLVIEKHLLSCIVKRKSKYSKWRCWFLISQ